MNLEVNFRKGPQCFNSWGERGEHNSPHKASDTGDNTFTISGYLQLGEMVGNYSTPQHHNAAAMT